MKRYPVFSLLGASHSFHVTIYPFVQQKFKSKQFRILFLAVLLTLGRKLCRLSYCMYISLNSSEAILKQNMEQMKKPSYY